MFDAVMFQSVPFGAGVSRRVGTRKCVWEANELVARPLDGQSVLKTTKTSGLGWFSAETTRLAELTIHSAESEGFEPPVPLRVLLISNQTRSTTPAALCLFLGLQRCTIQRESASVSGRKIHGSSAWSLISPASDRASRPRSRTGSLSSPSSTISFVMAASVVMSAPLTTPISSKCLLVW